MNTTLMTVNGHPVSRFERDNVMQEIALGEHEKNVHELEQEQLQEVAGMAMDKLLVWELLAQAAADDGISVADAEVDGEIDRMAAPFDGPEGLFAKLAEAGVEPESLKRLVRRDMTVDRLLAREVQAAPEPTDEAVAAEYESYLEQIGISEPPSRIIVPGRPEPAAAKAEAAPIPRAEAEPMIRDALRRRAGSEAVRARLEGLREAAEIEFPELPAGPEEPGQD